jgi:hypothetical protein
MRDGAPSVIVTGPAGEHVAAIAIASGALYFGTIARDVRTRGALRKVIIATGASSLIVSGVQVEQVHLDADGTIYFVADEVQSSSAHLFTVTELQAPVDREALVPIWEGDEGIPAFIVRAGTVYLETTFSGGGYIWSAESGGGGRVATLSAPPTGLDVGAPFVAYWTSGLGPSELATIDSSAHSGTSVIDPDAGTVLATATDRLSGPILDGDQLYFVHMHPAGDCAGSVMSLPVTGGTAMPVSLGHSGSDVSSFAVDGSHVYWTTSDAGGLVFRAAKAGGMPEVIAEGQAAAAGLALDDTRVYWIAAGPHGDEVRSVAK